MTINKLVVAGAVLASLAIGGVFYAQTGNAESDAAAPAPAAPAPAADAVKEAPKEASKEASKAGAAAGTQLPADKSKLYNETMKQAAENNQALRTQIQKLRNEADALLIAEKFDRKAYLAKANEMDKLYDKSRERMNEAFVSIAEKFSREERQILLQNRNARQHQQQLRRAAQQQKKQQ